MDIVTQREAFLAALTTQAAQDPRLRAVWLEGSLGRGNADRYSDVDLHVLLGEDDAQAMQAEWEGWLSGFRPLVLFNLHFGGAMINALTVDGLRIDLWPHAGDAVSPAARRVKVLHAQPGRLTLDSEDPEPQASQERALAVIREFWRCISLVPAVIGRQENLVGLQGLAVELGLVTELLMLSEGVVRDRGVKHLNPYLPSGIRQQLEQSILPGTLTPSELTAAHLRLAEMMQIHGPLAAERLGFNYPQELEGAVLSYVRSELPAE
ncbi:hypothetical protein SAMN04488058_1147 [Deinococcus reticulitermitis]|uniref:Polymerase nucleotidyl transferase domain-containing protein n=1 Tax=Deinococcus reticulitermitis TaxID=856736 RepID=A0A1H7AR80_9DEIO|nr:nucleotidyltransferase domain-containing protein [Deinococcus reticulitermitis]SEJ67446.1 hypothetical protein SAMN04488058_1147 [Deinococcus reticulitermitis]